jgi:tocopherol cyclase
VRARLRRTGADRPFGDPAGHHGVPMEGYYWRMADASGRTAVAVCGVVTPRGSAPRALVALGIAGVGARWSWIDRVRADPRRLDLRAGGALHAGPSHLSVSLGSDARLEATFPDRRPWPRRALGALGAAHLIPGLQQYWHPHMLGGSVEGEARLGEAVLDLAGATAYAEKNWGRGFPSRWWWGQALRFTGDDACLAFAGGRLAGRGPAVRSTALVLRVEDRILRLVAPTALVRVHSGDGHIRIDARGVRSRVAVEAATGHLAPLMLPVPPLRDHAVGVVAQHQDAYMRVVWSRGRRTVWRGRTDSAALERGELPRGSRR